MMQRIDQHAASLGVVQQIVLQIGVALYHPDVAQHFIQHARRASSAAFFTQFVQHLPQHVLQPQLHDLSDAWDVLLQSGCECRSQCEHAVHASGNCLQICTALLLTLANAQVIVE